MVGGWVGGVVWIGEMVEVVGKWGLRFGGWEHLLLSGRVYDDMTARGTCISMTS